MGLEQYADIYHYVSRIGISPLHADEHEPWTLAAALGVDWKKQEEHVEEVRASMTAEEKYREKRQKEAKTMAARMKKMKAMGMTAQKEPGAGELIVEGPGRR